MTVGTLFEGSHVTLDKWAVLFLMLCSTRTGVGAREVVGPLEVDHKTARSMIDRVAEALADSSGIVRVGDSPGAARLLVSLPLEDALRAALEAGPPAGRRPLGESDQARHR